MPFRTTKKFPLFWTKKFGGVKGHFKNRCKCSMKNKYLSYRSSQMPIMTIPLAMIFSLVMSRSLFTRCSLRASDDNAVNTQGSHVNSVQQEEKEEEDVVCSREVTKERFAGDDLRISILYHQPCEHQILEYGALFRFYGARCRGCCLEVEFLMLSWLVST